MNIFTLFLQEIKNITVEFQAEINSKKFDIKGITLESPKNPLHGDLSTNVAMVVTKLFKKSPQELAEKYCNRLKQHPDIKQVSIAGPGFINIKLNKFFWIEQLKVLLEAGKNYGKCDVGKGKKVNIEYVSTNPTGPLHIGHCRVAIVGDVLANLLKYSNYNVTKEYYINDAGNQANELARSVYKRYLQALGTEVAEIGSYGGDYLIPIGQKLANKIGNKFLDQPEEQWLLEIREFAISEMMVLIKKDLEKLAIKHDVFTSELSLIKNDKVTEVIDYLKKDNLIYEGYLPKPKGFAKEDWETRKQLLFKSTKFGDDIDRAIKKMDDSWTYFASDIAYHFDKIKRGSHLLINIWGADHGGYVKRLLSAIQALSKDKIEFHCILCHLVKFVENGQSLKMSKRAGIFITVSDVLQKTSLDALRFMMVFRKNDATLDFDFVKVAEQSKDNPVFYVQYAYARCHSIKRKVSEIFPDLDISNIALSKLSFDLDGQEEFIDLVKKLLSWAKIIEVSSSVREPHRIAYFLYELSAEFHSLWNKGDNNLSLRFIDEKSALNTQKNFAFVAATITILESGLSILGINPRKQM